MFLVLVLITTLLISTTQVKGDSNKECAVDQRNLQYISGGRIISSVENVVLDREQCCEKCCASRADGERCNAASFYIDRNKLVCVTLECDPFDACHFEPSVNGISAKVALFNTTVKFESPKSGLPKSPDTSTNNTTNPTQENSTESETKQLSQEEMNKKVGEFFDNDNKINKWNIDYSNMDYTTTGQMDQFTTTFNYREETTTNFNEELKGSTAEEQQTTEETGTGSPDKTNKGQTDKQQNVKIGKPHLTHANTGIYGPSEVADFDYSATPLIVIGAVVTVLFLLMVLICVGRKLSASERLKYRPLRDSFPASNSYHDID